MKVTFLFLLSLSSLYLEAEALQDTLFISSDINSLVSKRGVLYQGIDNVLEVPGMNFNREHVSLSTNNGKIFMLNGKIFMIPSKKGFADIHVSWNNNNDTLYCINKRFYVVAFPLPTLMVDNIKLRDGCTINRKIFLTCDSIHVFYSQDLISSHTWSSISHFVIGYDYGSNFMRFEFKGKKISQRFRDVISQVPPGKEISLRVFLQHENGLTSSVNTFKTILY